MGSWMILGLPLIVWLGFVLMVLIIMQILVGKKIISLPFTYHTKILWVLILVLGFIHMFLGLENYIK